MIKIAQLLKSIVLEGGGVFRDSPEYQTNDIDKNDIELTIEKFTQELTRLFKQKKQSIQAINSKDNWLGSTGTAFKSGDIDIAYSVKHFFVDPNTTKQSFIFKDKKGNETEVQILADLAGWGIDKDNFVDLYTKYRLAAKTASDEQLQLRTVITLIVQKVNSQSQTLHASDKASGAGSIHFSFPQYLKSGETSGRAQLDLDIGDMDWLKFRYNSELPKINSEDEKYLRTLEAASKEYYGNPNDPDSRDIQKLASKYGIENIEDLKKALIKGLHRGQLMLAMFAAAGYTFKSGKGFIRKADNEIVATTPEETIKVYNAERRPKPKQPLSMDIVRNYDRLMQYIKDNLTDEEKEMAINMFKQQLKNAKAYEPDNVNL